MGASPLPLAGGKGIEGLWGGPGMKRLLIVFAVLVTIAIAAAVAGILLSDREGGSSFLGPTVLVWRVQGPVPEQARTDVLGLSGYAQTSSVADLYRGFRDARDAPEDARAQLLLGHVYAARGWRSDALGRYETAVRMDAEMRHDWRLHRV